MKFLSVAAGRGTNYPLTSSNPRLLLICLGCDIATVRSTLRSAVMVPAVAVLLAAVAPAWANPLKSIERLFDKWELFRDVRISGSNTLTLQQHYVEGSESAFEGQRWDTGSLQRRSSLSIEGSIWKEIGFQSDLSFSGYGPSYSR